MKVLSMLVPAILLLSSVQPMLADNDNDQQQKDFEQKQRIYGTKHPWENTAPYGTQYTPPQSGVGSSSDSDSQSNTKPGQAPAKPKQTSHTKMKTKSKGHQTVSTKHPSASAKPAHTTK